MKVCGFARNHPTNLDYLRRAYYVPDSGGLALGPAPVNLSRFRNWEYFKAVKWTFSSLAWDLLDRAPRFGIVAYAVATDGPQF
jgi:hypothetical protein